MIIDKSALKVRGQLRGIDTLVDILQRYHVGLQITDRERER